MLLTSKREVFCLYIYIYSRYPLLRRRIASVVMSNIISMIKLHAWSALPLIRVSDTRKLALNIKSLASRHAIDIGIGIILAAIVTLVLLPKSVYVDEAYLASLPSEKTTQLIIEKMQNETLAHGQLPKAEIGEPARVVNIPITAYTSDVAQTDSTPCITASGLDVCERNVENVVAANFLPIGTRVRIPELYGDRIFYVEDRMNARYNYKMDIWMKDITDAREFGLKYAEVEIF